MNTEDQWGDYYLKPGREDSSLGKGSNQGHGEKWKDLGYILNIGTTRLSGDLEVDDKWKVEIKNDS